MANVQPQYGHTQIANRILEAIIEGPFSDRQVKVLLVILRMTYGWKRKSVRMTEIELAERAGVVRGQVKRAGSAFREDVALLIKNRVILRLPTGRRALFAWGFQKNFERWDTTAHPSPSSKPIGANDPCGRRWTRTRSSRKWPRWRTVPRMSNEQKKSQNSRPTVPPTGRTTGHFL